MATLNLHNKMTLDVITIPGIFIDQYMIEANGEFVKIYLYLLRATTNPTTSISVSQMADLFDHTEKDILRALTYWEKLGLLRLGFNSNHHLTDISLLDTFVPKENSTTLTDEDSNINHASTINETNTLEQTVAQTAISKSDLTTHTNSMTSNEDTTIPSNVTVPTIEELSNDDTFTELLFIAQTYMKTTFSPTDCNKVAYWYALFNRSSEIIEYLVEYCVENGHNNMRYMEKVALNWHKKGLLTLPAIRDYCQNRNKATYAVMKAFGISDRQPGNIESEYINKWSSTYGFSTDLIVLACEKTLTLTGKVSFQYADKILTVWKEKGVSSLSDVQALDSKHQENTAKQLAKQANKQQTVGKEGVLKPSNNKFINFEQRDTDYDQLIANYYGLNQ